VNKFRCLDNTVTLELLGRPPFTLARRFPMPHHRIRSIAAAIREVARAPGSRDELVQLAATLAAWQARVMAALTAPPAAPAPDRMLTAEEATRAYGLSKSFLYARGEELGLARRPPGLRGVRFSERELRRWMERGG